MRSAVDHDGEGQVHYPVAGHGADARADAAGHAEQASRHRRVPREGRGVDAERLSYQRPLRAGTHVVLHEGEVDAIHGCEVAPPDEPDPPVREYPRPKIAEYSAVVIVLQRQPA